MVSKQGRKRFFFFLAKTEYLILFKMQIATGLIVLFLFIPSRDSHEVFQQLSKIFSGENNQLLCRELLIKVSFFCARKMFLGGRLAFLVQCKY